MRTQGGSLLLVSIEEEIVGVENAIAKEFVDITVKLVCAGLGDDVNVGSRIAAEGGVVLAGKYFEFLDGVGTRGWHRRGGRGQCVVDLDAVNLKIVVERPLALAVHALAFTESTPWAARTEVGGVRHRSDHSWRQANNLSEVPSDQRQSDDLRRTNNAPQITALGLQQRFLTGYDHSFRDGSQFHGKVERGGLRNDYRDAWFRNRLEAGALRFQVVRAGLQQRNAITAICFRLDSA